MTKLLPLLIAVFSLAACPPTPCANCQEPNTPVNPDFPDAGDTRSGCQKTCDHLRLLKCEEAAPTNDGATCEAVCENMQNSDLISYDLVCAQAVKTCEEISSCPRK